MTVDSLQLESERLVIRQWQSSDYEPFAVMNQDSEVMRFFPKKLTQLESDTMIDRCKAGLEKDRYGFWAVEEKQGHEFLGFVALVKVQFECHFSGLTEIGWRLKRSAWGKGFASEGARRLLELGFSDLGFTEIVSLTAKVNERSWKVMERIGMTTHPHDDFEHPKVEAGSPLRPHVLYRLQKKAWDPTAGPKR